MTATVIQMNPMTAEERRERGREMARTDSDDLKHALSHHDFWTKMYNAVKHQVEGPAEGSIEAQVLIDLEAHLHDALGDMRGTILEHGGHIET